MFLPYQNAILDAQNILNCSADFLCAVSGVSSKKLSRFMKDIAPLTGPELEQLMSTIRELRGLQQDAHPLPLAFSNARIIGGLLEKRRAGLRIVPILVGPDEVVEQIELEMETAKQ